MVVPVPGAATSVGSDGFTANWSAPAVGVVSSYKLDVSTSSTFDTLVIGYDNLDCGSNLSQAVTGLSPSTTYYYRVRAFKISDPGKGANINFITVTTSSPAVAPTITSFTPLSAGTGTTVTITGTNFTGATAVKFGGTNAASFIVVSSTSITAVVGNGTTGDVSVTTSGGTATLGGYSYIGPPAVAWQGSNYFNPVTATTASASGNITATNGADATSRGAIFYPYTDTDKTIGDAGVISVDSSGVFGTGVYPVTFTGLTPNTCYNARALATNTYGTGYGVRTDFRTLAKVPGTPTVNNPTAITLDVTINRNGNPDSTKYCISDSVTNKYVQADSTLGSSPVWNTATEWGTVKVRNLNVNSAYKFRIKALNGDDVETDYSSVNKLFTLANKPSAPTLSNPTTSAMAITVNVNGNPAGTLVAVQDSISTKFVQEDGTLGASVVWQSKTAWDTTTISGLAINDKYTFKVKAKNGDQVETIYGASSALFTLANIPTSPEVINPTATSLDVAVNVNSNPAATQFAIHDSVNNLYVKADGTRGATAVWQTAAQWDTINVSGLTTGTMYYFRVKARNGDSVETVFSLTTGRNTCANPAIGGTIGTAQQICKGSAPAAFTSISLPSDYGGVLTYKWQYATADSNSFSDLANTDSVAYVPGALNSTTWYRRLARVTCKADWTGATPSNVIRVFVFPASVGGKVAGDTVVCYGNHSTVLALSGQTGSVQKWQYSTNGTSWNDISDSTNPTYTATNLTVNTWFRAVVKNGECLVKNSDSLKLSVFRDYRISGYAKYENNPKTPLNGLSITLKRNDTIVGTPYLTGATGYYEFKNLITGTYKLDIKSAHSSGNWQTWSGVNNTDYLLALRHATTGPLLPENPPVTRVSGDVKSPKTPPEITTVDADAIRMAAKYGWGSPKPYFDIPKWVFSGLNPETRIDSIVMQCGNLTRDIRGLCTGDVNGSHLPPNGYKMAEPSLELVNRGTVPVTQEIIFPVRAAQNMELGAITLMLDYDTAMLEITGVDMPDNGGSEPYFVLRRSSLVLEIGWMSLNPVNVAAGQTVLLINTKLKKYERRTTNDERRMQFTLNENPLSELADGAGNVLYDARLSVADAGGKVPGSRFEVEAAGVVVYPNPAKDLLNMEFVTGLDVNNNAAVGTCHGMSMEMYTMQGILVSTQNVQELNPGLNKTTIDLRDLTNGAYMLKVTIGDQIEVRKVIVNR